MKEYASIILEKKEVDLIVRILTKVQDGIFTETIELATADEERKDQYYALWSILKHLKTEREWRS